MTDAGSDRARPAEPDAPRVSVVMAVYNGEAFLGDAINSIVGQTFRDFELVIVDDGSTDRSPDIVRSYDDPRIVLVENPTNEGLGKSLNRGLVHAAGEYVARLDADDMAHPDRLARQVAFLDAHPEVALVGSAYTEIDEEGHLLAEHEAPVDHTAIAWALHFYCPFVHSAVMFRRTRVLEAVGSYDPEYHYSLDYEFWSRIAARFRVANLPDRLVLYRTHGESMTATFGERTREGHKLRVDRVARLLGRDQSTAHEKEKIHARLYTLLFDTWHDMVPQDIAEGLQDLARLHEAFARDHGLSRDETTAHRSTLGEHAVRSLIASGRTPAKGSPDHRPGLRLFVLLWRVLKLNGRRALRPLILVALLWLLVKRLVLTPAQE